MGRRSNGRSVARWVCAPVAATILWVGCDRVSDGDAPSIAPASGEEAPGTTPGAGVPGAPAPDTLGPRDIGRAGPVVPPPESVGPSSAAFEGTAGAVRQDRPGAPIATLRAVRAAAQEGYDRVVFEFSGEWVPGYEVEYIDRPIRACGSGEVVPIAGDGWLRVRFPAAQAHTPEGVSTIPGRSLAPNLTVLRELKLTCDFEGELQWVLGLASPNRYRVAELTGPARLVVDVRH